MCGPVGNAILIVLGILVFLIIAVMLVRMFVRR
jgi:hypothetical protein